MAINDYQKFVEGIKDKTKIDLHLYKEIQMKRRLEEFRDRQGVHTFEALMELMEGNQQVFNDFLDRMTINVSEFYRNRHRWEILEKTIIPRLLKENKKLRIWSAACSTGEEPYTMAMILSKYIPLNQISILATDIDEKIIKKAKKGMYLNRNIQEVPEEMLSKYFKKVDDKWEISEDIKKTVQFKKQNLLESRFEKDFDLIICRNVMIYFTEKAKDMLFDKFNDALKTDGVLFVGGSEQIFDCEKFGFETEQTSFYKKK